jgi:DNA-binding IclR family transcriptional regulator
VLLLLHRRPDRAWSPAELSAELKTTPESVAGRLAALERDGLVEGSDGSFRFGAGPRAAAVGEVASCYATHRVAMIETIFSVDRQFDALRSFADAFRVRRDPG